jgi:hypothetical protein
MTPQEEADLIAQGWRPMAPGVQGAWLRPPCHDGPNDPPLGGEALDQSCPPPQQSSPAKSHQFRIRLSHHHTIRWQQLRAERQDAADLVFGSRTEGIDLKALSGVASELRSVRLTLTNLLQLAHFTNVPIHTQQAHAAIDRISTLLGDRP